MLDRLCDLISIDRFAIFDEAAHVGDELGGALEAVPLPKAVSATPKDSEPFRPRWSGVSFAPRAAGLPEGSTGTVSEKKLSPHESSATLTPGPS